MKNARVRKTETTDDPETLDIFLDTVLSDELESVYAELKPKFDDHRTHDLTFYYEVGQTIDKSYQALAKRHGDSKMSTYGEKFFQKLTKKLALSERLLYNCHKVVCTYDEEQIEELSKSEAITASHLFLLAYVNDADLRENFQKQVIDERLTVECLYELLQKQAPKRRRAPGGGRPLMIPKTAMKGLDHVLGVNKKVLKLHDEVWFGKHYNIATVLGDIPSDKLSKELQEQTAEAAHILEESAAAATAGQAVASGD